MEIPQVVIPEIPVIHIPTTNQSLNIALPRIDMAGCTKTHRDVSVKNTQIISDDLNGAYYSCPAGHIIPSYIPINYDPKKLEDPTYKHYEDFQRFKLIDEARIEANKLIKPVLKKIFKDNKNQLLEIAHKYESSGIASGYVSKAEEGTGGSPYSIYIDLSEINSGIQKTLEAEARELVGQYNKAVLAKVDLL